MQRRGAVKHASERMPLGDTPLRTGQVRRRKSASEYGDSPVSAQAV